MAHKFRLREAYKKGQYFEHSSDALESVYFCDVCNKELNYDEFWEKGGNLKFEQGKNIAGNQYAIYLDLCDDCFQGLKKNIENAQKEGKML